ncbi:MAG: class B sortase, partial [Bacillota bacterium]
MHHVTALIALYGTKVLTAVTSVVVFGMLAYSGFVLYDTVYTSRTAFSSWNLTQYRPIVEEEPPSFEEMQEINQDSRAWIIMPGTHIDYPVVQGKDDLEYAMKDVYGQNSLTGSIYLSSVNSGDFTDSFNLLYGHYMDNGAMFGDVEKYEDSGYFSSHQNGYLITTEGIYDLHMFARLSADAYDSRIYFAGDRDSSEFPDFLYYVKSLAVQWDPKMDIDKTTAAIKLYLNARAENIAENGEFVFSKMPEDVVENGRQLIALSTCADATTNGRQILVGTMKMRTEPLPESLFIDDKVPLATWGHGEAEHWALLNLICLIMILALLFPGRR